MLRTPDDNWHHWSGVVGRWGLVLLMVFILLVLSAFPFQFASLTEIRPFFMMMAVYYWAITRPSLLPPFAAFFLGLLLDLLGAWPMGINALTLVLVQWITRKQRKFMFAQPFLVMWAGLALMACGVALLQWLLFMLFHLSLVPFKPIAISALLTILLFPIMVLPLHGIHKMLSDKPSPMA
jgi:rod shape-determining protein MreD